MKKIDMIADHLLDGSIRPIRFRVSEEEENIVIKIGRVIHEEKYKEMNQYKCEVVINKIKKLIILQFQKGDTTWYLKD